MSVAEIHIQNVVASTSIGEELDLNAISAAFENAEYEPEQFPGLVFRVEKPKTAALIFRSGKVVCTGAKSIAAVDEAVNIVINALKAKGIQGVKGDPEITIQNIVATSDLHAELNLNAIAVGLGLENVEYEPEQFPGLVYRLKDPKVVVLIFGSGKLVCTGARKAEDAERAVDKITAELSSLGLLF
ncbi:MAG TPA: TATA-box-binding protein [Candidatus Thermoplasmatota archaeon]|nr:TATA-box-binding protein [Candidatus Thermoplasmatota archaeon]